MENEIYQMSDELTHWGVTGMKWGIRRYQNKDGSLTAEGRKRYNAELAKVREREKVAKTKEAVKGRMDRLKARQAAVSEREKALKNANKKFKKTDDDLDKNPNKKSVKDMTDEELRSHINRIRMENEYKSLTATPEATAKGQGFIKEFMSKSVVPGLEEGVKSFVKDKIASLGKGKDGSAEAAEKVYDAMAKYNKQHSIKKLYEKNLAEEQAAQAAKDAAKAAKQAEKQAAKDAKRAAKNLVTTNTVSSGQSTINKILSSTANTSSSNVSSSSVSAGQAVVGKYDRAAIAGMDDD